MTTLPIPRPLRRVGDVKDKCVTRQDYESAEKLVVTYNVGFVELDGTEGVSLGNIDASADVQQFNIYGVLSSPNNSENAICSHFERANVSGGVDSGFQIYNTLLVFGMPRDILLEYGFITGDSDTYVPAFKAYLAAQNTSGTPVQVAYQLASPETYATDPVDFDNTAGPLTIMTGGELEVTLTHRMLTPYTTWAIRYEDVYKRQSPNTAKNSRLGGITAPCASIGICGALIGAIENPMLFPPNSGTQSGICTFRWLSTSITAFIPLTTPEIIPFINPMMPLTMGRRAFRCV